jgi:hypothetical protein
MRTVTAFIEWLFDEENNRICKWVLAISSLYLGAQIARYIIVVII